MALQKCNVNFSAQILGWIFWCEFWAVNFLSVNFWGGSFYWKTQDQKIRPQNSAPKFGTHIFVSQNSTPNSGSRGAKSPLRRLAPDKSEKDWEIGTNILLTPSGDPESGAPKDTSRHFLACVLSVVSSILTTDFSQCLSSLANVLSVPSFLQPEAFAYGLNFSTPPPPNRPSQTPLEPIWAKRGPFQD